MPNYATLVGSSLADLIDPRSLRGSLSDSEIRARALKEARGARATPVSRIGINAWGVHVLTAIGHPNAGTGKNGALTKHDVEVLFRG